MLWFLIDYINFSEFYLNYYFLIFIKPFYVIWNFFWIEWFLLQISILYLIYKLYMVINHLRQIITLMLFVIFISLYLAIWQLELFACFLFLGEFTILIFFYCLFLHLKTMVNDTNIEINNTHKYYWFLLSLSLVLFYLNNNIFLIINIKSFIINLIDLYQLINNFIINDLISIFYYFILSNIQIHFIIGIMLLILTVFLFLTITYYTSLNLTKHTLFNNVTIKLFTTKGYYEQTSLTTQKYFSTKN